MNTNTGDSYKRAGVDVEAGYKAVEFMKQHVTKTYSSAVLNGLGGFGGLYEPNLSGIETPVLVSGADGVGTKLKIAFVMDKHDTIGIDCVAMCANDVLCAGARPLFFLDYIATGKNFPLKIARIVSGIAEGCLRAGCALIGGETAEMPGFYAEDEYDLAGFCVGMADKKKIIDGSKVKAGDVILGLASSGVHSNGFSLVRKLFGTEKLTLKSYSDELGSTVGETLLTPTKIYVKPVLELLSDVSVHSIAHITGGGFFENIPRMLPPGHTAHIEKKSLPELPIFPLLEKIGGLKDDEAFGIFNMGVGMCIAVAPEDVDRALAKLKECGEPAVVMGEVKKGDGGVKLW